MRIRRTRPYSPWQNGKAERSHREDGKILYGRKVFTKIKEEGSAEFMEPRMDEGKAKFPFQEDIILESLRLINLNNE